MSTLFEFKSNTELSEITNKENTGTCNTNDNTCDWNTGYRNTGDSNEGNRNAGSWNTGNYNTGSCNTGNFNLGNYNAGDCNTGYFNTGDYNTGSHNTGDYNAGYFNTGDCNTGNWNTGDWNTGDWNTGFCNTITPNYYILVFNKPCKRSDWKSAVKPSWMYVSLTKWVDVEDMSDKEKEENPTYKTTGGYLKAYPTLQAAYVDAWNKASKEDKELTFKLPNFDINVFKEIFGFTPIIEDNEK